MKHFIFPLFLLLSAAPLFANDSGGNPAYIPSYQELVREGYGPRYHYDVDDSRAGNGLRNLPKPTQAYYGRGFTVYYGYTTVPAHYWYANSEVNMPCAFGYPLDYYRHLMPASYSETNLAHYATTVSTRTNLYDAGNAVAKSRADHANAVSTVQSATTTAPANGANPLPAIGEGPAQEVRRALPAPQQAKPAQPAAH